MMPPGVLEMGSVTDTAWDPVVFEDALIMGRAVPVAGEAVQLPHKHRLKGMGGAVVDHLLGTAGGCRS